MKFIENKNCSPISKKIDDEFDFDLPVYFKDNQQGYDNKTLYSNNSILNANISNITASGLGNSLLTTTNNLNNGTIYQYNKNFFDTTTLNNINGNKSPHGSSKNIFNLGDKEIEIPFKDGEELFQNPRRKKETNSNIINIDQEDKKKEEGESDPKKKKEMDFDNCNVYLKNENNENPSRLSSRKRSAYKFIETTMEKSPGNNINMTPNTNTVKSTKDPLKDLGSQFNNFNLRNKDIGNGFMMKNSITSTNVINNNSPGVEKKAEYQSRRKNQNATNILSELDNPKVVDINMHSSNSNKKEIDKNDHYNFGFRKNNTGSNNNLPHFQTKEMTIGNDPYKKGESNLGLFNSRRHITNTNTINNLSNTNLANNAGSNNKPKDTSSKEKGKFLVI